MGSAHKDTRDPYYNGHGQNMNNSPNLQAEADITSHFILGTPGQIVYIVDNNQNQSLITFQSMDFEIDSQTGEQYIDHNVTNSEAGWTRFQYMGAEIPHNHVGMHKTFIPPYVKLHKMDPSAVGGAGNDGGVYNIEWGIFKRHFGPYSPNEINQKQQMYYSQGIDPSNPVNYEKLWGMRNFFLEDAYKKPRKKGGTQMAALYANNRGQQANLLPAVMALLAGGGGGMPIMNRQ